MNQPLIILGAGGHARAVAAIALAANIPIKCFVDHAAAGTSVLDFPVEHYPPQGDYLAISAVGDNGLRQKLTNEWYGPYATLIHPRAWIGPNVPIEPGCVIGPHAVVHVNAALGAHTIINTGATVDHDAKIGNFVHIAPGANLCGGVTIEDHVLIGAGATIIPGITIEHGATIGAGATVLENVPARKTWVGTPARPIRQF